MIQRQAKARKSCGRARGEEGGEETIHRQGSPPLRRSTLDTESISSSPRPRSLCRAIVFFIDHAFQLSREDQLLFDEIPSNTEEGGRADQLISSSSSRPSQSVMQVKPHRVEEREHTAASMTSPLHLLRAILAIPGSAPCRSTSPTAARRGAVSSRIKGAQPSECSVGETYHVDQVLQRCHSLGWCAREGVSG